MGGDHLSYFERTWPEDRTFVIISGLSVFIYRYLTVARERQELGGPALRPHCQSTRPDAVGAPKLGGLPSSHHASGGGAGGGGVRTGCGLARRPAAAPHPAFHTPQCGWGGGRLFQRGRQRPPPRGGGRFSGGGRTVWGLTGTRVHGVMAALAVRWRGREGCRTAGREAPTGEALFEKMPQW